MAHINKEKFTEHLQKQVDKAEHELMKGDDMEINPVMDMTGHNHIWYHILKKADEAGSKLINVSDALAIDLDSLGFDNYIRVKNK